MRYLTRIGKLALAGAGLLVAGVVALFMLGNMGAALLAASWQIVVVLVIAAALALFGLFSRPRF